MFRFFADLPVLIATSAFLKNLTRSRHRSRHAAKAHFVVTLPPPGKGTPPIQPFRQNAWVQGVLTPGPCNCKSSNKVPFYIGGPWRRTPAVQPFRPNARVQGVPFRGPPISTFFGLLANARHPSGTPPVRPFRANVWTGGVGPWGTPAVRPFRANASTGGWVP